MFIFLIRLWIGGRVGEVQLDQLSRLELGAEQVSCRSAGCPAHTATCTSLAQESHQDQIDIRGWGEGATKMVIWANRIL